MKRIVTVLFTFFLTTVFGQTDDYTTVLDSAKTLFKSTGSLSREELDNFDYYRVASLFEKAVALGPQRLFQFLK
ncbi:MAG TPA: hypothetical protein PLL71_06065 [Agriterribacter sp.]|nr:hypothetical protein [Agriterribacter sp.]HRQ49346.1 hypothetical protein [Agriterribacter sp.]